MSLPQKQTERQPTLQTAILQNKFTLWHIRLNIYIWKTKFSSHKQYLFELLFPRNAKKTHTDQSIPQKFSLCLQRNISQTLKSSSFKKVFPNCVWHWYSFLWCFLFHVMTRIHYFLYKFIVTLRFGTPTCVLWIKCFESLHFIFVISTITLQCC